MDEFHLLKIVHVKFISKLLQLLPWLAHSQILELDLCHFGLHDAIDWFADTQITNHTVLTQNDQRDVQRCADVVKSHSSGLVNITSHYKLSRSEVV